MVSRRIVCPAFVGRKDELEHLGARRAEAAEGHGGIVLVSGEAGIGKSRLIAEFCNRIRSRTTLVGMGACREFAQRPLAPLIDVLHQLSAKVLRAPLQIVAQSKAEQLDAIAAAFAAIAARRATIVLLEDLHWADLELLQTLVVVAQAAARQRLLFVATYRDTDVSASQPAFALFGRILREPSASHVSLGALDSVEMDELLHASLAGHTALPTATMHEVRRRAGGNALFAEELLRNAVDRAGSNGETSDSHGAPDGAGNSTTDALPLSLKAVVLSRLSGCTPVERTMLEEASLFGTRFAPDALREIFGGDSGEQRQALKALGDLQLIDAVDEEAGEFRFRHALTRDIVYAQLEPAQTRTMHARIADSLADSPDAADRPEELAHHFWLAADYVRAAPYCEAAADAAIAVHAYHDAAAWYERAETAFGDRRGDVARVVLKAGYAVVLGDAIDRAISLYGRAADLYLAEGNVDEFIKARVLLAGPIADDGRPGEAIALLESTRATAQGRASPPYFDRLLVRLAKLYTLCAQDARAWECIEAIDANSIEPGSRLEAEYAFVRAQLHSQRGESAEWRSLTERGIIAFELAGAQIDDRRVAFSNAGLQALYLGETWLARSYAKRALEIARASGIGVALEAAALAQIEVHAGNFAAAQELLRSAQSPRRFMARAEVALATSHLALRTGERPLEACLALELLDDAGAAADPNIRTKLTCVFAWVLAEIGRRDEALALAERGRAGIGEPFGVAQAVIALALIDPALVAPLRPALDRAAASELNKLSQPILAMIDALSAKIRGDAMAQQADGIRAATAFASVGWPWHEARCKEIAGDAKGALAIYRRLGSLRDVRRLETARERGGDVTKRSGVLTPRERELAEQIAAGKPNREAADALSISEKAVEKHLTSIYAKLGLRSRTELAAYLAGDRQSR